MKDENNFRSFSDFTDRYNIETNFLTFQGVISAVKALWKSNAANLHIGNAIHESITDTFLKMKKPNRLAYKILVSKNKRDPSPPKGNGSRIACLKPKKISTGRQFTEHLFYAQNYKTNRLPI